MPPRPPWVPLILVAVVAASVLLDPLVWSLLPASSSGERDWHRLLRVMGWLPTWCAVGLGFALHDGRWRRAIQLVGPATAAGASAEVLKLLVRRTRPDATGEVVFRAFSDRTWDTSGLGMPSSHVAVAFGAAFALARLHPRTLPLGLALAAGCALTRVIDRAHLLSDCAVAALLAWVVVVLSARLFPRQVPT